MSPVEGRASFRMWVDALPDPNWPLMPLTHITRGIGAEDILQSGFVDAPLCSVFNEPLAYFFYGRPAYRLSGDNVVKAESACPFCFVFDAQMIKNAKGIYAFDTGAFENRMYKNYLEEEMGVQDYSLEKDQARPNKLIRSVFGTRTAYFDGDVSQIEPDQISKPWEFHARAYLNLLSSHGRNEPDDRVCSIEVLFDKKVELKANLQAVVVPHTLWSREEKAPWLKQLESMGARIAPYIFVPCRHPEYYHALMEAEVKKIYTGWGSL